VPKTCRQCGRLAHRGLCDMVELTDGRIVHASRVDSYSGDVHEEILRGLVQVKNRWIKKNDKRLD
jgi:hypothetical protein